MNGKFDFKAIIKKEKRDIVLVMLIVVVYVMFIFLSNSFGTVNTVKTMVYANASMAIAAIGMTFIILTGAIDLSAGASIAFSGAIGAMAMTAVAGENGMGPVATATGFAVAISVGAALGMLNAFIITFFKVSPFMATLATQCLARGLTLGFTNSMRIVIRNDAFVAFGQGSIAGVPYVVLVIIALYALCGFLLKKTVFGRKTLAIGDNKVASAVSGIQVNKQMALVYAFAGVMFGLASVYTIGRAISAQPLAAMDLEFEIITAVIIGGTLLSGGQGTMRGTFLGVILLSIIKTGLNMMDVSPYFQYVVKGVIILVAILADRMGSYNRVAKVEQAEGEASHDKHTEATNWSKVMNRIDAGEQRVLSLKNIHKSFPGVKALDNVSLELKCGTVHALIGENGAGKSTLMKVLSGVYTKDAGTIEVDGLPIEIKSPIASTDLGIRVIYQELALIPELSVAQNVFLGKEVMGKSKIVLDMKQMRKRTEELLAFFEMKLNVRRRTNDYTVGQQQMIEISKAFSSKAWVIVMDEPTSAITEAEKEHLFRIVRDLKAKGVAVVYISHRMPEIFEIADEVTVLRDGKTVYNAPISEVNEQTLIKHMVGRDLNNIFDREKKEPGDVVLEVKNLSRKGVFQPISFEVRAGEVLGFSGLMGAGRTEIMRCIAGLDKPDTGEIYLNGKQIAINSPGKAISNGICLVSEDRRREGIIPHMEIVYNISLPSLPWLNTAGIIDEKQEWQIGEEYVEKLRVKTPSLNQHISNLSGGNQQKCCIAKCLVRKPKLIILDEPTRGIDVGAKSEIHKLIDMLVSDGMAVIIISSELPEIIGAADRIIVLHEGLVAGEFSQADNINQELLITAAAGGMSGEAEKAGAVS